jgi:hypothetical protein
MRDPKRIARILKQVETLWNKYPDSRLGQLLVNTSCEFEKNPFSYEDGKLEEDLARWIDGNKSPHAWKEVNKGDFKYKKCAVCDVLDLRPSKEKK